MYLFPSRDWAEAYCEELNRDQDYAKAARNWRHGPVMFVVTEVPEAVASRLGGVTVGFILDLHEGKCKGVSWTTAPETEKERAAFVITAPYRNWVSVIKGELHPVTALMTMKLKVEKGDIGVLLRFAQAAIAMVNAAKRVPTELQA